MYVGYETTLLYNILQIAGLWLASSHMISKCDWKNKRQNQPKTTFWCNGPQCLCFNPPLFLVIWSPAQIDGKFWATFKPTHAFQTSQRIKEPTVDYSTWWLLFWLVPRLDNSKGLLSCANHIQPPTDSFVLLCLLRRPWSTQGSHLWHW